jgi:hypothetical protein
MSLCNTRSHCVVLPVQTLVTLGAGVGGTGVGGAFVYSCSGRVGVQVRRSTSHCATALPASRSTDSAAARVVVQIGRLMLTTALVCFHASTFMFKVTRIIPLARIT